MASDAGVQPVGEAASSVTAAPSDHRSSDVHVLGSGGDYPTMTTVPDDASANQSSHNLLTSITASEQSSGQAVSPSPYIFNPPPKPPAAGQFAAANRASQTRSAPRPALANDPTKASPAR
jgi:hypothetical protein